MLACSVGGKRLHYKDSWIYTAHQWSKLDILKELEGIEGVLTLVTGEDVHPPNGKDDCTLAQPDSQYEVRVHCRLVMTPVCQHLSSFWSKKELIGAFINII